MKTYFQRWKKSSCFLLTHLISKKHFNGEASRSRGDVFNSDGVIGIGNDVKIHILFLITDHISVTLDSDTDVTWKTTNTTHTVCNTHMKRHWISERVKRASPSPASVQSTVKCVGSWDFSPLLSTPGPNTLTLWGWHPFPTLTYRNNASGTLMAASNENTPLTDFIAHSERSKNNAKQVEKHLMHFRAQKGLL